MTEDEREEMRASQETYLSEKDAQVTLPEGPRVRKPKPPPSNLKQKTGRRKYQSTLKDTRKPRAQFSFLHKATRRG